MKIMGRHVCLSPTEPVPASMRIAPGVVYVTAAEFKALYRGDPASAEALTVIIHDREREDLRGRLAGQGVPAGRR